MELWATWNCPTACGASWPSLKGVFWSLTREIELGKPRGSSSPNPKGGVPVLVDGATIVTDSLAILEHLDDRLPQPSLFPAAAGRDAVKAA